MAKKKLIDPDTGEEEEFDIADTSTPSLKKDDVREVIDTALSAKAEADKQAKEAADEKTEKEKNEADKKVFWEQVEKDAPTIKDKYGKELNTKDLESMKGIFFLNYQIMKGKNPDLKLTPAEIVFGYTQITSGEIGIKGKAGTTTPKNFQETEEGNVVADFDALPTSLKKDAENFIDNWKDQWKELAEKQKTDPEKFVANKILEYKKGVAASYKAIGGAK